MRVTVLVFGRDVGILVVAAILYAATGRREFSPSIFGKANTLAQMLAVAAVLLHPGLLDIRHYAGWRSSSSGRSGPPWRLTVASGLHYAWIAARRAWAPAKHQRRQRPQRQVGRPAYASSPASQAGARHILFRSPVSQGPAPCFRSLPGWVLFRRFLQSPCRGTLRSQRPRHNPGTRQIRCLRAGKRFVP
jgi:hypothetical protein